MPLIPRLFSLWRHVADRDRIDRALDEELRATFELLVDEKIAAGMRPAAARRAATLELGRIEVVKEQVRDVTAGAILDTCVQDVRRTREIGIRIAMGAQRRDVSMMIVRATSIDAIEALRYE